jgi:rhomboid protease GluP
MSEDFPSPDNKENQSITPPPQFSESVSQAPVPPLRQVVRIKLPPEKSMVTFGLIAVTVLAFLGQLAGTYFLGADRLASVGMKSNYLIEQGELWRLFTAAFLHGGVLHIAFNMYALQILGRELERFFGHARFLALYLVGGFAGNVFSYLFTTANSLGASTAIFGLLGAYGLFILRNREVFGSHTQRVLRNVGQVLLINLAISLTPGIDMWGHLGGLLGGAFIGWFGGVEFNLASDLQGGMKLVMKRSVERYPLVAAAALLSFGALVVLKAVFF